MVLELMEREIERKRDPAKQEETRCIHYVIYTCFGTTW